MSSQPFDRARVGTLLQHLGEEDIPYGAACPPIVQTSTFKFDDYDEFQRSFDYKNATRSVYTRIANPTMDIVEQKIAALEGLEAAKLTSGGMSALAASVLTNVKHGDHVVAVRAIYIGSILSRLLPQYGVSVTMVEGRDLQEFEDAIQPDTKLIVLESPCHNEMHLQDLEGIAKIAKRHGIATTIDNSFCSPIFQNPADFGIDIVVHSASKYLGGHSDVIAGVVVSSRERINQIWHGEYDLLGQALSPFNAWLILRGMRTLKLRMMAHDATGKQVAAWLRSHPAVDKVFRADDEDHPQRALALKQMRGGGGTLTFRFGTEDRAKIKRFVESLRFIGIGVSWGGPESLIVCGIGSTENPEPAPYFARVFCGLEEPEDIIGDLSQAFDAAGLGNG